MRKCIWEYDNWIEKLLIPKAWKTGALYGNGISVMDSREQFYSIKRQLYILVQNYYITKQNKINHFEDYRFKLYENFCMMFGNVLTEEEWYENYDKIKKKLKNYKIYFEAGKFVSVNGIIYTKLDKIRELFI